MAQNRQAFGEFLREMIRQTGITQAAFYTAVGITKPYFYDILAGKINPPPADVQYKMLEQLTLSEAQRDEFFDLAAQGRDEVPADIAKLILDHPERREDVRSQLSRLVARKEMAVWQL